MRHVVSVIPDLIRDALFVDDIETPTDVPSRVERRGLRRLFASGLVSLTGLVLFGFNVRHLLRGGPLLGTGLAGFAAAVAFGLLLVGFLLYRSRFSTVDAARIAAWNVLGVVVLGVVMVANIGYQQATGTPVSDPAFTVANLLAIGAGAHVIIGFYDVRRVRAEQLARERRKIAVLNRVLRHNLRNEATVLQGHADLLAEGIDAETDPQLARSAAIVRKRAETVGSLSDGAKRIMQVSERGGAGVRARNLTEIVDDVGSDANAAFPNAAISVSVTDAEASVDADGSVDDYWAMADEDLGVALFELVENAVQHSDREKPTVTLSVSAEGEWLTVVVGDDGPGIPDHETAVLTGESSLTQLQHGSGLGLWVVKTISDASRGRLDFERSETGGSDVRFSLRRADDV